jgi:6-phosphofructokinase
MGIPKTVDNDLAITDCSPGFGSMAKYVATSIREAAFDLAAMSRTSTQVFVLEVMGRHAGWATAACALAATRTATLTAAARGAMCDDKAVTIPSPLVLFAPIDESATTRGGAALVSAST